MPQASVKPVSDPEVAAAVGADGARTIKLLGAWDIRALETRARMLQGDLRHAARQRGARWDLTQVQRLDHIGALLIWRAWSKERPAELALAEQHRIFFSNLDGPGGARHRAKGPGLLAPLFGLGAGALALLEHTLALVRLIGQMLLDALYVLNYPHRIPWREMSAGIYRAGAQALGITAAVGFLIGVVLSYLSAEQLRAFGADALIINILGIGIIRELGPMICAVLVAGRSGSAITAQLGVMRVTQELDALAVMGIPHSARLILPKVIALSVTLPLLTLWTCSVALLGGALAAQMQLGMTVSQFFAALPAAVPGVNVWLALGKAVVFGALIALVACHFGLRIEPNTESLGAGTTASVVTSITVVIVADAIFAVAFSDVGIALL